MSQVCGRGWTSVPRRIEDGGRGHRVAALRNVRARVDGASRNAAADPQASNADAAGGSGVDGHRLRDDLRLRGTFAPFFRASLRPIAIACLRLLTVPPFPPGPLFSVPFFRRRIADLTFFDADFPYFAMCYSNADVFGLIRHPRVANACAAPTPVRVT